MIGIVDLFVILVGLILGAVVGELLFDYVVDGVLGRHRRR